MPGHDHSLRKLYTIEGLSNPSMVYNWVCPVLTKEDCPYEALARIFSMYFKDTSGINTSEDYLNFGWAALLLTLISGNSASGMTWELPKKFYIRCVFAFHGAFPQSPVPQGPSHLLPLTGQLQRRSILFMRRVSLRPQKVGAQPSALRALGHPRLW